MRRKVYSTKQAGNRLAWVPADSSTLQLEQQQRIAEVKKLFGQAKDGALTLDNLENQILALLEAANERERALVKRDIFLTSSFSSYEGLVEELVKAFTKGNRHLPFDLNVHESTFKCPPQPVC
ncbi:hypothetical protein JCM10295v2_006410 [Rhodotorula toruloides]